MEFTSADMCVGPRVSGRWLPATKAAAELGDVWDPLGVAVVDIGQEGLLCPPPMAGRKSCPVLLGV